MAKVIGIDLGTTHSIVAYVPDERPVALTTCDGSPLLPSVVYYGAHEHIVVGPNNELAVRRMSGRITGVRLPLLFLKDSPQRQWAGVPGQNLVGVVGATIVDDDDFPAHVRGNH